MQKGLEKLHLHAWLLSGRLSDREAFLKEQPSASLEQLDSQQGQYMNQNCQSFVLGVCLNKLILSVKNLKEIRSKDSNGESCKNKSQAGTKRLCFGRSIHKFLNMSDKNSSLPKSGPPERWIVLAIADL
jgi:hypothetical protein